ncbi:unnamed protein product [Brugia timori]|uniref:Uncharacterized protein n=1 Tax=Brugia timori TaxID=42155 RepID=A0A0R3RDE8_9BILA|nr:unnamed protein product [Brugia timori]
MQQHNFYRLKLGLPGTTKSEVLQGKYAKLILPAASNDYLDAVVTHVESWTTVHIQLANAYHILSKLQKELKKIYHTTKSLSNPLSGNIDNGNSCFMRRNKFVSVKYCVENFEI